MCVWSVIKLVCIVLRSNGFKSGGFYHATNNGIPHSDISLLVKEGKEFWLYQGARLRPRLTQ